MLDDSKWWMTTHQHRIQSVDRMMLRRTLTFHLKSLSSHGCEGRRVASKKGRWGGGGVGESRLKDPPKIAIVILSEQITTYTRKKVELYFPYTFLLISFSALQGRNKERRKLSEGTSLDTIQKIRRNEKGRHPPHVSLSLSRFFKNSFFYPLNIYIFLCKDLSVSRRINLILFHWCEIKR